MSRFGVVFLLLGVLILGLVGCSQDDEFSPVAVKMDFGSSFEKAMGPSEIVLCLDVSDSVSNEELKGIVEAVGACIGNPDLIPQDGRFSLGAIVYGDTIGMLLDNLVPVTPENLKDIINPALAGLVSDRMVPTTGIDLAGALDGAMTILSGQKVNDQHILLVGSGEADYPLAVSEACVKVLNADIMVSALVFRGNPTDHTIFQGCAESTGGYYQAVLENLEGACTQTLKYMLVVEMEVEPDNAELMQGEDHTVTATVFRGEDVAEFPVVGHEVTFTIVEGPNSGDPLVVSTDTTGVAAFILTGDSGSGTDTIAVSSLHPGTGEALTDTVTVTWANIPPTCDAGGPYTVTIDADTVTVMLDASGSSDADGDTLTFMWTAAFEGGSLDDATAATPDLTLTGLALCADSLVVDLMVKDSTDSSMCQAVIILDDQRAPIVEVRDEPIILWPVNHKYNTITPDMVIQTAEDACGNAIDLSSVAVVSVSSDEPEDHNGDGHTVDDIVIDCPNQVMLRAERMGGSQGRVYTITYRVTGENGVSTDAEFKVVVPHDSSGSEVVERDGMGYTVTPDCEDEG
jgi:hypothetical protein